MALPRLGPLDEVLAAVVGFWVGLAVVGFAGYVVVKRWMSVRPT